jgi:hypothetical protein
VTATLVAISRDLGRVFRVSTGIVHLIDSGHGYCDSGTAIASRTTRKGITLVATLLPAPDGAVCRWDQPPTGQRQYDMNRQAVA